MGIKKIPMMPMIHPIIGIQEKRAKISQSTNQTTIPANIPTIISEALANYCPFFVICFG
jgi:hypothetical protein